MRVKLPVKLEFQKFRGGDKVFLKLQCPECGAVNIVYNKASTVVTCRVCGAVLARPTGGKALIRGTVLEVLQ